MTTVIEEDYEGLSLKAARETAAYIKGNPGALLCLAAGDTPLGMFKELLRMQERGEVDLASVYYAGLDEWAGLGYADKGSCLQIMADEYYIPAGIPAGRIHVFDGMDPDPEGQCRAMETWIARQGGIGLAVLGIGMNGHIGFNEPGAPGDKGCFTIALDSVTAAVSTKYFGTPRLIKIGMTIGWSTLKDSRKLLVLAAGKKKAAIVLKFLHGPVSPSVPVSLLRGHGDLTAILDKPAAYLSEELGVRS